MKKIFTALAVLISYLCSAQSNIYLRGDSIHMLKVGGNAELILMSGTRDTSGVLFNMGNGRTRFRSLASLGISPGSANFGAGDNSATANRSFALGGNKFNVNGTGQWIFGENEYTSLDYKLKVKPDNYSQGIARFGDSTTFNSAYDFQIVKIDTATVANAGSRKGLLFNSERVWRPQSGAVLNGFYGGGEIRMIYDVTDSFRVTSWGGDFGHAAKALLQFRKPSDFTGRSVVMPSSETSAIETMPAFIAKLQTRDGTGPGNAIRLRGFWNPITAYTLVAAGDTVDKVTGVLSRSIVNGKTYKFVDFLAWGSYSGSTIDDSTYAYVAPFTNQRNFFNGPTAMGGLADNTNNLFRPAHPSALLDMGGTTKGFLPPRLTTTEQDAIASPASGLLIYNTDSSKHCYYDGADWVCYGSGSGGGGGVDQSVITDTLQNYWRLTGNNATAGASTGSFIGTTNNVSVRFRANNTQYAMIDSTGRFVVGNVAKFTAYDGGSATLVNIKQSGNGFAGGISMQNSANDATTMNYTVGGIASDQTFGLISLGGNIYHNSAHNKFGDNGTGTAKVHIAAGTTTAGTAPLKFTSGPLLTTAEAGSVEFLTDKYYGTITTGAARKEFTLNDAALTPGTTPVATTNGRLTDGLILASSTYTPTINADPPGFFDNNPVVTVLRANYMRMGTEVTVNVYVSLTHDATATITAFGVQLPVASNLTSANQLFGDGTANITAAGASAGADMTQVNVIGDATNDQAIVAFTTSSSGTHFVKVSFTYSVL